MSVVCTRNDYIATIPVGLSIPVMVISSGIHSTAFCTLLLAVGSLQFLDGSLVTILAFSYGDALAQAFDLYTCVRWPTVHCIRYIWWHAF